jgi:hypothetical protein
MLQFFFCESLKMMRFFVIFLKLVKIKFED